MINTKLRNLMSRIEAYADDPDPVVKANNSVALLIAANQPFFPLYLWFAVGNIALPAVLTLLSTPFFLAVPAISRYNSLLGRAIAPVFGAFNTMICAWALGVQSGVELFHVPCVMVAVMFFRRHELWAGMAIIALNLLAYLVLHGRYPVSSLPDAEQASLFFINLMSVAGLTVYLGITHATMLTRLEGRNALPESG
jgi:hypothetical protein